jgi:multisubunit Na+/H+ antiporter MnhG subunit
MELLSYCSFLTKSNFSSVGLQRILSLLEAEDVDVRIHAVKVVANLAAEGFFLVLYQHMLQLLFMGSANLFRIVLVLIYSPVGCHRPSDF